MENIGWKKEKNISESNSFTRQLKACPRLHFGKIRCGCKNEPRAIRDVAARISAYPAPCFV